VVAKVGDLFPGRRKGKPSHKAIEADELAVGFLRQVQCHQSRRAAQASVALDGHGRVLLGVPGHGDKGAVRKQHAAAPGHRPHRMNRVEQLRLDRFLEVHDRDAIGEPGGVHALRDDAVAAGDLDLLAVFIEQQRQGSFLRVAALVDHLAGQHFHRQPRPVGRPADGLNGVAERHGTAEPRRPLDEFFPVDDAPALAVETQHPDVVALHLEPLGRQDVPHRVSDPSIGRVGEGGTGLVHGQRGGLLSAQRGGEAESQSGQRK